ncbi:MAG: hypothetical protein FJX54_14630 [Alphaproteobacteria bacterium]|nr:hypothetical protein [Alphaproteobacteria bacterium]
MGLIGLKRLVLVAGAAATLTLFLKSTGSLAALLHFPTLVFLAWCLLPLGHLWLFGRDDDPPPTRIVMAAAAVMVVAFGTWVYVDMLVLHLDPQSGLAFFVVPALQMAVVVPAILVAWFLRRRAEAVAG